MVSIIIPNYNHSAFLRKRIESILNQTYKNYEVIILDDCSTDDSRNIIEQFRGHEKVSCILYNNVNSGSAFKQWFNGLEKAKGKYIWIAESDDYCDNNFLDITVPLLDRNSEISLVYSRSLCHNINSGKIYDLMFWYKNLSSKRWKSDFQNKGIKEIRKYLSVKNTIPNASAVLFRKDLAQLVINDVFTYKLSGDWLFWIKLLERGNLVYTVRTCNYFRLHDKSIRLSESKKVTAKEERERIINYLLQKGIITARKSVLLLGNRFEGANHTYSCRILNMAKKNFEKKIKWAFALLGLK